MPSSVIEAALGGDEAAVSTVWHSLNPGLLRYLRSLGVDDAQDVASAVWLELAAAFERVDPPTFESVRRLLFTIARRRMIDEIRKRNARPGLAVLEDLDPAAAESGTLAEALELLRDLPPAQAEVLALRVVVGMSVDEVASLTDRTPGAVRVMAHRALATLRSRLTSDLGHMAQHADADVTNADAPTNYSVQ